MRAHTYLTELYSACAPSLLSYSVPIRIRALSLSSPHPWLLLSPLFPFPFHISNPVYLLSLFFSLKLPKKASSPHFITGSHHPITFLSFFSTLFVLTTNRAGSSAVPFTPVRGSFLILIWAAVDSLGPCKVSILHFVCQFVALSFLVIRSFTYITSGKCLGPLFNIVRLAALPCAPLIAHSRKVSSVD